MVGTELENPNPSIHSRLNERVITEDELDNEKEDRIDAREIYDHIRNINDPEHPNTLEELGVVDESLISIDEKAGVVMVAFVPTVPRCSMASLIGLCIKVRLNRCLPVHYKVDVKIKEGAHDLYKAINKQLADKERIAAAQENPSLLRAINQCQNIELVTF